MKKLLTVAIVIALMIGLMVIIPAAGAAGDDALVYKCQLIDGQHSTTAYGEVMVWADGKVKVQLVVEGESAQTYDVYMDYGSPINRMSVYVGSITTGGNGKAIDYFDLTQTQLIMATTPGFVIRAPGVIGPASAVATTGFLISTP